MQVVEQRSAPSSFRKDSERKLKHESRFPVTRETPFCFHSGGIEAIRLLLVPGWWSIYEDNLPTIPANIV